MLRNRQPVLAMVFALWALVSSSASPVLADDKEDRANRIVDYARTLSKEDQQALLDGLEAIIASPLVQDVLEKERRASDARDILQMCLHRRMTGINGQIENTHDGFHFDVEVHNKLAIVIHGVRVDVSSPHIPNDVTAPVDLMFDVALPPNSHFTHRESGPYSPDMPMHFEVQTEIVDVLDAAGKPVIRTPFDEHGLGIPPDETLRDLSQIFCHGQALDR
jgi:hypothetical protein